MGRRVLITGLASFWGGRVARALEAHDDVDAIVGLDTSEPTVALERTEFVRADKNYSILSRLVRATKVDTVIHAALVVDSTRMADRRIHENNVIGTMNLLAAVAGNGAVTSLVVKSSTLVYGAARADPTWFSEKSRRTSAAKTRVERSLIEVESYVRDFARESPGAGVTLLRFANVLGGEITNPLTTCLGLPLVPKIVGFDPQLQFVEEHDVVRAIVFAVDSRVSGTYNVAGDGRLPWSEVLAIVGKRPLPLPPFLTAQALDPFSRMGIVDLPPEILDLLRFGRGVDNRLFKRAGFEYRFDTANAVNQLAEVNRLRSAVGPKPGYRYESDVETFFRHSPAVVHQT
ncbi:MAG: NAD-dependent epimerase/dehydratase family protein [Actinomycetota bacterium]|nr:NAD-dependent epimerase/dehydratase family protein [Actinomycetota bacterium]